MIKKIDVWLFGPEFGCVNRELPLLQYLGEKGCQIRVFCHKRHEKYLGSLLPNCRIIPYKNSIQFSYKNNFDLDFAATSRNILSFTFFRWMSEYLFFRKHVKKNPPDFILNDFMPHIVFFAKWHNIKMAGIYNYHLNTVSFGQGFIRKLFALITQKAYHFIYNTCSLLLLESLENKTSANSNIRYIEPIVRDFQPLNLNQTLGYNKKKYIFISLGGNFNPDYILDKLNSLATKIPEYGFIIVPRYPEDLSNFAKYPALITITDIEPYKLIMNVDLLITKAGFQTISEGLAGKAKILLWDLPSHCEISETAQLMTRLKLTPPPISADLDESTLIQNIENALNFLPALKIQTRGLQQTLNYLQPWLDI